MYIVISKDWLYIEAISRCLQILVNASKLDMTSSVKVFRKIKEQKMK